MDSDTKTYKSAPMQPAILGVTIFVFALLLFFIIGAIISPKDFKVWLLSASFIGLIILGSAQYRPFRYEIMSDAVKVIKGWPFVTVVIPISEIQSVERYEFTRLTLRLFGVGGLFCAGGYFWDKQIGYFHASITDQNRSVLIRSKKNFVLSPADPDAFITALKDRIGDGADSQQMYHKLVK
jgi:hypothetical protein